MYYTRLALWVYWMKLHLVSHRKGLAPQANPYWEPLAQGLFLGYSVTTRKWSVRYLHNGKYLQKSIGLADDLGYGMSHRDAVRECSRVSQEHFCKRVTVAMAWEEYEFFLGARKKSARAARYIYQAHIKPVFGDCYLDELTHGQIELWLTKQINGLQGEDLRKRKESCNKWLTYLKACLNHAYRAGAPCNKQAWDSVRKFTGTTRARIRTLSPDEITKLMGETIPSRSRDIILAGLLTGCRYSELIALRSKHFDGKRIQIETSKTGKGRWIPLSQEGKELFSRLSESLGPEDKMLGNYWKPGNQKKPVADAVKAANIPKFTFHELRHTYASMLLNSGALPSVVARLLGHTSTKMVDKHYGHLYDKTLEDQVEAHLGKLLLAGKDQSG